MVNSQRPYVNLGEKEMLEIHGGGGGGVQRPSGTEIPGG